MPIMKKGSSNNWTTLENHCFRDRELSYKEIGLLCNMLSLPDNWKFNVRGLASLHRDGVESVSNTLNSLIEKGYIYREQPNSSRGFKEIVYWIYQNPKDNPHSAKEKDNSPCTENPYTGNLDTEIRDTEEPYTENSELLNTNESNPKESNTNISVTEGTEPSYTEEEMEKWSEDDFYSHLSKKQYDAFIELFHRSIRGEIHSSKESLFIFFKKMMAGGWKDAQGEPIKNIVGYVTTIFNVVSEENRAGKSHREDIVPVYTTSTRRQAKQWLSPM